MFVLRKRSASFAGVDGAVLSPVAFKGLSIGEVRALPLSHLGGQTHVDALFECHEIDGANDTVVLIGDCRDIEFLGAGLSAGKLVVVGDVGDSAAIGMDGGVLVVLGNAGERCAEGLKDGILYVDGDCGDRMGTPKAGMKSGVRGGDIVVTGNVGERAFERMRRGTVLLAGDVANYLAPQMIAGTIVVLGSVGESWGGGLRRGSLVFAQDQSADSAATWSEPRDFELSFLPLIWKQLHRTLQAVNDVIAEISIAFDDSRDTQVVARLKRGEPLTKLVVPSTRWVERQIGDLNHAGRGEVLTLRRMSTEGSRA